MTASIVINNYYIILVPNVGLPVNVQSCFQMVYMVCYYLIPSASKTDKMVALSIFTSNVQHLLSVQFATEYFYLEFRVVVAQ